MSADKYPSLFSRKWRLLFIYTMTYTKMACVCWIFWAFLFLLLSSFLYFGGVFNKTIIPLALVGYEMIIANSALRASLAICHLISNARSWNIVKYITVHPNRTVSLFEFSFLFNMPFAAKLFHLASRESVGGR